MENTQSIEAAKEHFGTVLQQQLERVERLKEEGDWVDYSDVSPIVIGMLGGDGIGPTISYETQKVLEYLLRDEVASGKVDFRVIDGLTIENRAEMMQSIPDDVLDEIKAMPCNSQGPDAHARAGRRLAEPGERQRIHCGRSSTSLQMYVRCVCLARA